jgi:hypothetical protein
MTIENDNETKDINQDIRLVNGAMDLSLKLSGHSDVLNYMIKTFWAVKIDFGETGVHQIDDHVCTISSKI